MPKTLRVTFSDACSDVLVWLAAQPLDTMWTVGGIADAVAPVDASDSRHTTANAMRTLLDCGLIEPRSVDGMVMWRATDAGRQAVAGA